MPSSRGSSQLRDQTRVFLGLLHWQVGSLLPAPPGSPCIYVSYTDYMIFKGLHSTGLQGVRHN